METNLTRESFMALALLNRDSEVIAMQMAYKPQFKDLPQRLQDFFVENVESPRNRTIFYCNNIAVRPDHRRRGLASLLWMIFGVCVQDQTSYNGGLIACQIACHNQASERAAAAGGLRRTLVRGQPKKPLPYEVLGYWYSEIPPVLTYSASRRQNGG